MNIIGLDHFTIRTSRLNDTRTFFQVVLGLQIGWRPPFGFAGHWLYAADKPILHLVEAGTVALDTYLGGSTNGYGSGRIDHLSFRGSDLHQMQQHLSQLEIMFQERIVPEIGEHQLFLQDPNGITVEVIFPLTQRNASAEAATTDSTL